MELNSKGFIMTSRLMAACNTRPSYHGIRKDKKICEAKPGECRGNINHYTASGLRDEKSWSLPIASEQCENKCPYLREARNESI